MTHDSLDASANRCPLTGFPGRLLRCREPSELSACYASYLGSPLPDEIIAKYFTASIREFYSKASGLRWYVPAQLGDGYYYAALASIYPGYYHPKSWDKVVALEVMLALQFQRVIEIGCGDGWLLEELHKKGIQALGIDINTVALEAAKARGLTAFRPDEVPSHLSSADVLCLLQTIEHVGNPVDFLEGYILQFNPKIIVISAPCFESLLGNTKDPLSWPPHHATAWSKKAFETLGERVGFRLQDVHYGNLDYDELQSRLRSEQSRKLWRMPYIPNGRLGRWMHLACRLLKLNWACRNHSILVTLVRAS